MRKYKRIAIGSLLVAAVAVLVLLAVSSLHTVGWGNVPFEQEQWKAGKNWARDNPRGKMVRSLLRDYSVVGMTRSEIVKLLGPPDGADGRIGDDMHIPHSVLMKAGEFDYVLGAYSGFQIDYDYLGVFFDDSGTVERVEVRQG